MGPEWCLVRTPVVVFQCRSVVHCQGKNIWFPGTIDCLLLRFKKQSCAHALGGVICQWPVYFKHAVFHITCRLLGNTPCSEQFSPLIKNPPIMNFQVLGNFIPQSRNQFTIRLQGTPFTRNNVSWPLSVLFNLLLLYFFQYGFKNGNCDVNAKFHTSVMLSFKRTVFNNRGHVALHIAR